MDIDIDEGDLPDELNELGKIPYAKLKRLAAKLGLSGAGLKEDILARIDDYYYKG
jgi:hypothetical protein